MTQQALSAGKGSLVKVRDTIGFGITGALVILCMPFYLLFNLAKKGVRSLLGIKEQTFTRTIAGIGELQCTATNERRCRVWTMQTRFLDWPDMELSIERWPTDEKQLRLLAEEYKAAMGNQKEILQQIRANETFKKLAESGAHPLEAEGEVIMSLEAADKSNPYSRSWISLCYATRTHTVGIVIREGNLYDIFVEPLNGI